MGAVVIVVLVKVIFSDVRAVHPVLEGALIKGALAAGPGASVSFFLALIWRFVSEGGDGDEAGILEARQAK